jgi:cell wall-associated NlpC family hydrolase
MPNIESALLVAAARHWIGTPYVHQHRTRGHAVDCVGLIIGAGLDAGVLPGWSPEAWSRYSRYGRAPNPEHMTRAINEFLCPLDLDPRTPAPDASVAFIGWRDHMPMHLAIMATAEDGRRTMIHAFAHIGKVVEHGFDAPWPDRVVSWWSYPGIQEH